MALAPAITDIEQLKGHPAVARLLGWNAQAVEGVKFDRDEMTIYVDREAIREAAALLQRRSRLPFQFSFRHYLRGLVSIGAAVRSDLPLAVDLAQRAGAAEGSAQRRKSGARFADLGLAGGKLF